MRYRFAVLALLTLLALFPAATAQTPMAAAFPVATDDATYNLFGRVFPDPQGCLVAGPPGVSPWAKGNVCSTQFLQYEEVIAGFEFLESKHPRFIDLIDLREELGDEYQSAGLPQTGTSRLKSPLHAIKITDAESPIPEDERRHFVYSMSIHGIERAGIEGGARAAEEIPTWAACEADPAAAPACATEGPFPKQILETFDADPNVLEPEAGPTAGQVTREAVIYFILSNPDGWRRGDITQGGVFYQRYNGNGMDINRDWASIGYVEAQYTPFSEPETEGFSTYLKSVSDTTAAGHFTGGIDLHGMVTSHSFSFTLMGAGQRDYRKNAITVDTGIRTWQDAEERLTWSPQVARDEDCPGPLPEPFFGGTHGPMCTDLWGTVWDTIQYQVTGSFGDWMDSPLGLGAVGINNEMALSHLAPNNAFVPEIEQLHVDGNKGLVYSQIASLLQEPEVEYVPGGRTAYVFDPQRISDPGIDEAKDPYANLPAQDPISESRNNMNDPFDFEVLATGDGFDNGGVHLDITSANLGGIGPGAAVEWILDYCGPALGPDDPYDNECREVARYFNQASTYLQAGANIDLNDPPAGPYQLRANDFPGPVEIEVVFDKGKAYPEPKQAPYDASRMDFFTELNEYVDDVNDLEPLTVQQILSDPTALQRFDSVVIVNEFMPGASSAAELGAYADRLQDFANAGGNVVLTDAALLGLPLLTGQIRDQDILNGYFFAGWVDFDDGSGTPTYEHHLAADVDKPGAAEGFGEIDGEQYDNRHQTYEPGPIGYYISSAGAGNANCDGGGDRCDSPNWMVDQAAWEAAGGSIAGRTFARGEQEANSPGNVGVSLGELEMGKGRIRILGALLPDPNEANYHPYGLASYAVTYSGYQLFENLVKWDNPGRVGPGVIDPPDPSESPTGGTTTTTGTDTGTGTATATAGDTGTDGGPTPTTGPGAAPVAGLLVLGALGALGLRRRRTA